MADAEDATMPEPLPQFDAADIRAKVEEKTRWIVDENSRNQIVHQLLNLLVGTITQGSKLLVLLKRLLYGLIRNNQLITKLLVHQFFPFLMAGCTADMRELFQAGDSPGVELVNKQSDDEEMGEEVGDDDDVAEWEKIAGGEQEVKAKKPMSDDKEHKQFSPHDVPAPEDHKQQATRRNNNKMDIVEKADQFIQQRSKLLEELEQRLRDIDQQRSTIVQRIAEIKGDSGISHAKRRGRPPKPSGPQVERPREVAQDTTCPWCGKTGHDARAHRSEIIVEKAKDSAKYRKYLENRKKAA